MAQLRRFMDGSLPEADERIVASHVETCPACRAQVDRWTDDPAVLAGAPTPDDQPPMIVGPSLDRALAESDEAVRFAPWSAEARSLRAQVQARRGKTDLAEADNREANRLRPDPLFARP